MSSTSTHDQITSKQTLQVPFANLAAQILDGIFEIRTETM